MIPWGRNRSRPQRPGPVKRSHPTPTRRSPPWRVVHVKPLSRRGRPMSRHPLGCEHHNNRRPLLRRHMTAVRVLPEDVLRQLRPLQGELEFSVQFKLQEQASSIPTDATQLTQSRAILFFQLVNPKAAILCREESGLSVSDKLYFRPDLHVES